MPRVYVADDPLKRVVADVDFVVKTSGGVLVRAVNKRFGFNQIKLEAAAESRFAFGPRIKAIFFYDVSRAAGTRWINLLRLTNNKDYSLIDRNAHAATGVALFPVAGVDTGAHLNSWATGDFLYVCFEQPAGGIIVDTVTNNTTAATMAVSCSVGQTFIAATTLVDNTASGGATLGTGNASQTISGESITWTPQANWTRSDLRQIVGEADTPSEDGYWVRLSVSAGLDTTVSITSIYAMAALTASATANRGRLKATTEYVMNLDDEVGGIEFIAVAGADTTVDIDWYATRRTG
jgi:hypothetical protein